MVQCSIHVKGSGIEPGLFSWLLLEVMGIILAVCGSYGYKLVTGTTVSSPAHRSRWLSGTAPAVQRRRPPSADTC